MKEVKLAVEIKETEKGRGSWKIQVIIDNLTLPIFENFDDHPSQQKWISGISTNKSVSYIKGVEKSVEIAEARVELEIQNLIFLFEQQKEKERNLRQIKYEVGI